MRCIQYPPIDDPKGMTPEPCSFDARLLARPSLQNRLARRRSKNVMLFGYCRFHFHAFSFAAGTVVGFDVSGELALGEQYRLGLHGHEQRCLVGVMGRM
jgi:hypothetical protein